MNIAEILGQHAKWLDDPSTGARANLSGADLSGADLSGADLSGADLMRITLCGATLDGADLGPSATGGPGSILYTLTPCEWAVVAAGRETT